MLCLDEFDILELRENADECDYLFVVSPKIETKICTKKAGAAMLSITVDILNLSGIST